MADEKRDDINLFKLFLVLIGIIIFSCVIDDFFVGLGFVIFLILIIITLLKYRDMLPLDKDSINSVVLVIFLITVIFGADYVYEHHYRLYPSQVADAWVEDSNRLMANKIADTVASNVPLTGGLVKNQLRSLIKKELDEHVEWVHDVGRNPGYLQRRNYWNFFNYYTTLNISILGENHKVSLCMRVETVNGHKVQYLGLENPEVAEVYLTSVMFDDKTVLKDDIIIYRSE